MKESPKDKEQPAEVLHHFSLGEHLGEGGMAKVYTAHDEKLERLVALKLLRRELESDPGHSERFFQEARILADINHPGTIPVFEAGKLPDGHRFYSMQKIEGETLQTLLDNRTKEEIRSRHRTVRFIDIFERACQTVAYAHQRGVIHRDLKPDNIMVGELGQVFVIDWGLAKKLPTEEVVSDSMTIVGEVMGTPAYMSPEQAHGYTIESDERTDVFSLGTILYEILTGEQPFQAQTAREALSKTRYHDPDPPDKLNKRTNRSLSAVCMKCLHKDPFQRYPNATELALDVRRHLEHLPVTACKPSLREQLFNWVWRRPALASTAGTLAFLGFLTIFGMAFHASFERHLVGQAYAQIDEWKSERVAIAEEIERLSELPPDHQDFSSTQKELQRLHIRDRVLFDLIRGNARGVTGMLVYLSDDQAEIVLSELFKEQINKLVDQGRVAEARAYLEASKEVSENQTIFKHVLKEREWIDQFLDELNSEQ